MMLAWLETGNRCGGILKGEVEANLTPNCAYVGGSVQEVGELARKRRNEAQSSSSCKLSEHRRGTSQSNMTAHVGPAEVTIGFYCQGGSKALVGLGVRA